MSTLRQRFIVSSVSSYVLLASAWIFFSDQLLTALVNMDEIYWLSTAKGIFFIAITGTFFFFALRAVPPEGTSPGTPVFDTLTVSLHQTQRSRWLSYSLAVIITLCTLWLRHFLPISMNEHMLILYMLPIILSALYGGWGAGLIATFTAGIGAGYQSHLHDVTAPISKQLEWAFLIINGVVISALGEMLRNAVTHLQHKRQMLESIVSSTSDIIFVKDLKGRYQLINAAGAKFFGRTPDDIIDAGDKDLFDAHTAQVVIEADNAILASSRVQTIEDPVTRPDGAHAIFLTTKGPVADHTGKVIGLFGIARDITQLKANESETLRSKARLQAVISATSDGFWDWDLTQNIIYSSPKLLMAINLPNAAEFNPPSFFTALLTAEDLAVMQKATREHLRGVSSHIECDARLNGVEIKWLRINGRAVDWDKDTGKVSRIVGTLSDVSERRQLEQEQAQAAVVFDNCYEGIMIVGPDKIITKVNPAFNRITGYTSDEAIGQTPQILSSGMHDNAFYREMWQAINTQKFWRGEIWNRRKNGEAFVEMLSISVVRDSVGQVQHYVGVFTDISQVKAHEAELQHIAHYDTLTGIPNRRLLADRLQQALKHAQRSGKSVAVCFLDLDNFKAINDRYGHPVGDRFLISVSENLKTMLRSEDTIARLGGDEFVLLLADIGSTEECAQILTRVLQTVGREVSINELRIASTASIGVSLYPEDNADPDTLLRHADQAMYLAKRAGKNRYQLFDPENDRKAQHHRQFLELLEQALYREEFVLHYQPKVDLTTGEITGSEALIRWQHPERGLLSPAHFLSYLNGNELESAFGEWVIDTALKQSAQWHSLGINNHISVNISADHLLTLGFKEGLHNALKLHPNLPANSLELEILESAAIADIDQAIGILQYCHDLGVLLSLDDFGTGYSSLTHLRRLPVDILKIDQSFVRDMLIDSDDMGIVRGVIQLAAAFNRQVIAEGVETMEHGNMLIQMGCPQVQGYGIAKPMPASAFPEWCTQWQQDKRWTKLQ